VILEEISVSLGGAQTLDKIGLSLRQGEHWMLTGASGSGKTVLAHTLLGRHHYTGRMEFRPGLGIAVVEQQHRFRNLPGSTELYYQQRFNSSDAEQTITVEQELHEYAFMERADAGEWLDDLHIRHLLAKPLIQLSNGENKRVQLAIALSSGPDLLLLDNPFTGLDREGRETLHRLLGLLASKGIQLFLITATQEIPDVITHIARLEKGKWSLPVQKRSSAG